MYVLFICGFIGLVGFLYLAFHIEEMKEEPFICLFAFPLVGALFGLLVGFIIALGIGSTVKTEWTTVNKLELRQLKLNDRLEGSFFLACGKVAERDYYYFYSQQKDTGFLSLERVPLDKSYIVEDGKKHVEIQKLLPREDQRTKVKFGHPLSKPSRYIFHIPENSIQNYFEVGLENKKKGGF